MKSKIFTLSLVVTFFLPLLVEAAITLKQVQVANGSQIDLIFDGAVTKKQIETEFFNDIVQISLKDTSVYPAKISSVSGGNITKIFAYQYAPKLVRCRLSVKGKAENYKNQISITPNGKYISIKFKTEIAAVINDRVAQTSAATIHTNGGASAEFNAPKGDAAIQVADIDEKALLEKVLKTPAPAAAVTAEAPVQASASKTAIRNTENEPLTTLPTNKPLAGGKPLPSPFAAFGKLAIVLAIFGALALGAKKLTSRNASSPVASVLASLGLGSSAKRKKGKLIEIIASHYLGPKKSLAVIRVAGKNMVVGITGESINLISHLPSDADIPEELLESMNDSETIGDTTSNSRPAAAAAPVSRVAASTSAYPNAKIKMPIDSLLETSGPAVFSEVMKGQGGLKANSTQSANATYSQAQAGVRSQIKSRLEGLKQL